MTIWHGLESFGTTGAIGIFPAGEGVLFLISQKQCRPSPAVFFPSLPFFPT